MSSLFETDPRLTDYDTLLENIQGLKAGKPVQVPIYDFKSSSRIGYRLCTFHLHFLKYAKVCFVATRFTHEFGKLKSRTQNTK